MNNKKEKRPDTDLLQSILHNSEISITAINYLLPEVNSSDLEKTIREQKRKLIELTQKTKDLAEILELEIKPNSLFKKGKMWLSIKTSSFFDDDTQHLAELMIVGYFMGTINMIKSLADCKKARDEIIKLARELKKIEEDGVNELVPFLERAKK